MAIKVHKHKTTMVNPERKHRKKKPGAKKFGSRRAKRKAPQQQENPGALFTMGLLNPQRKRTMKKTKKCNPRKKKGAPRVGNPHPFAKKAKNPHKKRHNPERLFGTGKDLLVNGLAALVGLVATRQLPQLLLKDKNTSYIGYASNAVTAVAASYAAKKFANEALGNAVLIGGGLYLVNRILTEQLSPVGQVLSLSGVGDHQAASTLGRVRKAYWPYPTVRDKSGNYVIPSQIDAQSAMAALQAKTASSQTSGINRLSGFSRIAA
jgi:hypothetical protein